MLAPMLMASDDDEQTSEALKAAGGGKPGDSKPAGSTGGKTDMTVAAGDANSVASAEAAAVPTSISFVKAYLMFNVLVTMSAL